MEFSSPVAEIFNASIQEKIVPDLWKEADVIPIPKSVAVKVFENDLRPISLTPIPSKTMEHFVAEWIMSQTRRLVGVHSGYMVLVSGPQDGQWQCYADCLGGEY